MCSGRVSSSCIKVPGEVTPPSAKEVRTWSYTDNAPQLKKGEELGRFNMGSTIIALFGEDAVNWEDSFVAGEKVQLGEQIGSVL
jgi:phosphatidylserine decarboxylase